MVEKSLRKIRNLFSMREACSFASYILFTLITCVLQPKIMPGIFRKCHVCGEEAILRSVEPDFKKGVFRRIFECRNGHRIEEESSFDEERKWIKEVFSELAEVILRRRD